MKVFLLILISCNVFAQCPFISLGPDINLLCTDNCIDVTANYSVIRQTNQYTISNIPYNPLPYNLGTVYNIGIDDRWSNIINLPFDFCFYNQIYNRYVIGTNGIISFNTTYAGLYCPWPFTVPIPSNNPNPPPGFPRPMIGLYHDIDPSLGGEVRYGVTGVYPCRKLVVSFNDIPHFNCPLLRSKFQIILYELTNIIEIHIERKQTCGNWNGGRACLGIQNAAGTNAYSPIGRNTGNYTINLSEAWRFTPSGPIVSNFQWYNTNISNNPYNHCYASDSTLIGVLSGSCGSTNFMIYDTINVNYIDIPIILEPINHN